jgi:hypothetical protein
VRVDYRSAPRALIEEIVFESWSARAPKRLIAGWRGFEDARG